MYLSTILGIIGLTILLIAFVSDLFNKMNQNSIGYNALNIIGCGLLAYYAFSLESIPFVILEIVWGLFASVKLTMILIH